MEEFLRQLLSGFAIGAIYAGIALALVMSYTSTRRINFAQGEMAMFSAYIAWILISVGLPYWVAFFFALVLSFVVGVTTERLVMRPFASAPVFSVVAVSAALLMIFNSLAGALFGYTIKSFPSPFSEESWFENSYISPHELGTTIIVAVLLASMFIFFRYTRAGLAMRAAAQNPESSRLVGIRVGWMRAFGWGLAAVAGAISAIMAAPIVFLEPNMMSGILLYGFAAALVGGIDNPWGAAAGGFIVGMLENIAGAYVVGTGLKLTVALIIIVGVLVAKPSGLFGRNIVTRV
jgi:branched-chain amino acid transport system permease protein